MDHPSTLKVGVSSIPPLIIKEGDRFGGFEIELWEEITRRLQVRSTYIEHSFKNLLRAVETGEIDAALAGITMTPERDEKIDFTHSTFDSGLQIMVPNQRRIHLGSFFNKDIMKLAGAFLLFVAVAANLMWFVERNGPGTLQGPYAQGVFNAIWWAVVTASTIGYGDYTPVTVAGRILGIFFILVGVSLFGFFIAQLTSFFTVKKLRSEITRHDDLRDKRVATQAHTVSVDALAELGAVPVLDAEITDSYKKLERGEVDAVVFDAPAVRYYGSHEGRGRVTIVGEMFHKQHYAVALQKNSALRKEINRVILEMYENGVYVRLYQKWFGGEP